METASEKSSRARFYLRLPHKYPTILLAGEVALALHGAVVLALGLVQNDSHPFPGGEEGVADVGHRAALPLADHLHQGAHLDGPAAPVRAHPAAAAAGGLEGRGRSSDFNQDICLCQTIVFDQTAGARLKADGR